MCRGKDADCGALRWFRATDGQFVKRAGRDGVVDFGDIDPAHGEDFIEDLPAISGKPMLSGEGPSYSVPGPYSTRGLMRRRVNSTMELARCMA
jgi:hypothetical protein